MQINFTHTILFVKNQHLSTDFYTKLFRQQPILNVPGMTEFLLHGNHKLGLMPNNGIAKILSPKILHPEKGIGIPRCELYCYISNLEQEFNYILTIGATLISPIEERNWGDKTCYFSDLDGHILAFAEKIKL